MKNVAILKVLCNTMKNIALFKDCNIYHCKFTTCIGLLVMILKIVQKTIFIGLLRRPGPSRPHLPRPCPSRPCLPRPHPPWPCPPPRPHPPRPHPPRPCPSASPISLSHQPLPSVYWPLVNSSLPIIALH